MPTPSPATLTASKEIAQKFVDFINASPSPYHAVQSCVKRLEEKGYKRLSEKKSWASELKPSGKYFFTRNNSSLIAFSVGGKFQASNGIKILGAHTDSPNFMIKPASSCGKLGFQQVSVAPYGGGLWHTWFDRDLTVAGRLVTKKDNQLTTQLVHVPRPILFVPNLCIHLQSATEREAFKLNKENHICPLLCTSFMNQLNGVKNVPQPASDVDKPNQVPVEQRHQPALLKLLAEQASCKVEDITEFDLYVCCTQPAVLGGIYEEFVHAPRIDNLSSSYCALEALLASDEKSLETDTQTRVIALFDHEEVGSDSTSGAGCNHIESLLRRLVSGFGGAADSYETAVANSFMISSDSAHLIHPCYPEKHHELHRPAAQMGPVLKFNSNQRYATSGVSAGIVRLLAQNADIPLQEFAVRSDMPCGSTIGPILSTRSGIRTVDIGLPQLAMHSVRETCGTLDLLYLKDLMSAFLDEYQNVVVEDGE